MQLQELSVGDNAFIEKLTSQNALRERMLALGLTKGTKIEAIRKGSTGDSTIYKYQRDHDSSQKRRILPNPYCKDKGSIRY